MSRCQFCCSDSEAEHSGLCQAQRAAEIEARRAALALDTPSRTGLLLTADRQVFRDLIAITRQLVAEVREEML